MFLYSLLDYTGVKCEGNIYDADNNDKYVIKYFYPIWQFAKDVTNQERGTPHGDRKKGESPTGKG